MGTLLKISYGAHLFLTGMTAGVYLASFMTHEEARANITAPSYLEHQTSPTNLFGTVAPLLMFTSALSAVPIMVLSAIPGSGSPDSRSSET